MYTAFLLPSCKSLPRGWPSPELAVEEIPPGRDKGAAFLERASSQQTLWLQTNFSPRQSAHCCQPSCHPFPTFSCPSATRSCSFFFPWSLPQPWQQHAVCPGRVASLPGSLPSRATSSLTNTGFTRDPRHIAQPRSLPLPPLSSPALHSPAAQTTAHYYWVVAWIPLKACQSAQRAESELFKLHLLKDPWCLFLLFVFSNSLKS